MRTHLRWDAQPSLVIPGQPPGAINWVTSIAQDGQVTVSWGPTGSGGAPQTYTVTPFVAGAPQTPTVVAAPASSAVVTGLTNSTAYTFQVTATNQAGIAVSPMSGANTPLANLVFGDDFNGTVLDPAWVAVTRDGDQSNSEQSYYLASNAVLDGAGNLVITARTQPVNGLTYADGNPPTYAGAQVSRANNSGMVQWRYPGAIAPSAFTGPGFNFVYGQVQVSAKIPNATNLWPAIWLLGANCEQTNFLNPDNVGSCAWPAEGSGEMDIAEFRYSSPNSYNAALQNGGTTFGPNTNAVTNGETTFHTYELDWSVGLLTWKLDGVTQQTTSTGVPSTAAFLIMSAPVRGGALTINGSPNLVIDWVRVFHN